jgi:alpha-ribazole phosphatase
VAELFLVRHAPTSWSGRRYCGRADPALTRAGQRIAGRLAADLGEALAPSSGAAVRVVSSPARRARQTASAVAEAVAAAGVDIDERWAEADFGVAEGLTFETLAAIDPRLAKRLARGDVAIDWPAGESAAALMERTASAFRDLLAGSWPTVVVSHAGPLRIAIALATGLPLARVGFLEPGGWRRLTLDRPGIEAVGSRMLRSRA